MVVVVGAAVVVVVVVGGSVVAAGAAHCEPAKSFCKSSILAERETTVLVRDEIMSESSAITLSNSSWSLHGASVTEVVVACCVVVVGVAATVVVVVVGGAACVVVVDSTAVVVVVGGGPFVVDCAAVVEGSVETGGTGWTPSTSKAPPTRLTNSAGQSTT